MSKIFGFAFSRFNISVRTLYSIPLFTKRTLLFGQKTVENYIQALVKEQPKYIVGMGIYTGIDRNKIRVETVAINNFRRNKILPSGTDSLRFISTIVPGQHSKFASNLGTSFCNLACYSILSKIYGKELKSKFIFFHIPKRFNQELATQEITSLCEKFLRSLH